MARSASPAASSTALAMNNSEMNAIILGDMGAMQGAPTTGEPFVIVVMYTENQEAFGAAAMVMPIDGATSVTLSIAGEKITPISEKFLPKAAEVKEVIVLTNNEDGTLTLTYDEILTALTNGVVVIYRVNLFGTIVDSYFERTDTYLDKNCIVFASYEIRPDVDAQISLFRVFDDNTTNVQTFSWR